MLYIRIASAVSLVLLLIALMANSAWAIPPLIETKITAPDAAADDQFGSSVALDGRIAIVGARNDDDRGENSGSAYLFDAATGAYLRKLTAADGEAGDTFGFNVGLSGDTAVIGAKYHGDRGTWAGSAYLFDVTTGDQSFKLLGDDTQSQDFFGCSVAIDGDIAIVGAYGDDDAGSESGSAYLFDAISGDQLFKLTADDAATADRFGWSVEISGNTAIVGALRDDGVTGSAYLFDVTTGNQLFKLTASDAASGDQFGHEVAIDGDTAIIGAIYADAPARNSGAAYLFDATTGNEIVKLNSPNPAESDYFGAAVRISGDTAVVGAYQYNAPSESCGTTFLFDTATGEQIGELTASDPGWSDCYGVNVAIDGDTILVAAQLSDDAGESSGSAYLYAPVPEPSSLFLTVLAVVAALAWARKRR